jgi:hypothetical protein
LDLNIAVAPSTIFDWCFSIEKRSLIPISLALVSGTLPNVVFLPLVL